MKNLRKGIAVLCVLVGCDSATPPAEGIASTLATGMGSTTATGGYGPAGAGGGDGSAEAASCAWTGAWLLQSPSYTGECELVPPLPSALMFDTAGELIDGGSVGSACSALFPPVPQSCQVYGIDCEGWSLQAHFFFSTENTGGLSPSGIASVFTADGGTCSVTFTLALRSP